MTDRPDRGDGYTKGMQRLDSGGALLVLRCTECGLGWEKQISRQEFSNLPHRERAADQWADLLTLEHERQQHPERAQLTACPPSDRWEAK